MNYNLDSIIKLYNGNPELVIIFAGISGSLLLFYTHIIKEENTKLKDELSRLKYEKSELEKECNKLNELIKNINTDEDEIKNLKIQLYNMTKNNSQLQDIIKKLFDKMSQIDAQSLEKLQAIEAAKELSKNSEEIIKLTMQRRYSKTNPIKKLKNILLSGFRRK